QIRIEAQAEGLSLTSPITVGGARVPPKVENPLCLPHGKSILVCIMPLLEPTQDVPLSVAEDGTIRIADTRVSLESVVQHYEYGATAEEIVLRFPALRL